MKRKGMDSAPHNVGKSSTPPAGGGEKRSRLEGGSGSKPKHGSSATQRCPFLSSTSRRTFFSRVASLSPTKPSNLSRGLSHSSNTPLSPIAVGPPISRSSRAGQYKNQINKASNCRALGGEGEDEEDNKTTPVVMALGDARTTKSRPSTISIKPFLRKTYDIVGEPSFAKIVSWTQGGRAIMIHDLQKFTHEILPKYFKHSNFNSFVRQLNMYGFHKTKQDPQWREFKHPLFRKGHRELLSQIERRARHAGGNGPSRAPRSSDIEDDVKVHLDELDQNVERIWFVVQDLWEHTRVIKDEQASLQQAVQTIGSQLATNIELGNMMLMSIRQLWEISNDNTRILHRQRADMVQAIPAEQPEVVGPRVYDQRQHPTTAPSISSARHSLTRSEAHLNDNETTTRNNRGGAPVEPRSIAELRSPPLMMVDSDNSPVAASTTESMQRPSTSSRLLQTKARLLVAAANGHNEASQTSTASKSIQTKERRSAESIAWANDFRLGERGAIRMSLVEEGNRSSRAPIDLVAPNGNESGKRGGGRSENHVQRVKEERANDKEGVKAVSMDQCRGPNASSMESVSHNGLTKDRSADSRTRLGRIAKCDASCTNFLGSPRTSGGAIEWKGLDKDIGEETGNNVKRNGRDLFVSWHATDYSLFPFNRPQQGSATPSTRSDKETAYDADLEGDESDFLSMLLDQNRKGIPEDTSHEPRQ